MGEGLGDALLLLHHVAALVGLVLVAGPLAFWATVASDGRRDRRQLLLVDVGVDVLVVVTLIEPALLRLTGLALADIPRETWASVLGRLALLAALASWFPDLVDKPVTGARRAWAAAAVVGLSATFLAAPPGAAQERGSLAVAALLVHVVAAVVWLGAAVVVAVAGVPVRDLEALTSQVRSYSRTTSVCVVAVVASGAVLVLDARPGPGAILDSPYGVLLVLKALVFVAMLVAANRGRRTVDGALVQRLRTGADTATGVHVRSLLLVSQVVGAAVLLGASVALALVGLPAA